MSVEESIRDRLGEGDEAPEFSLHGVDGGTHSLEDFSDNEAVLIVFTCNHCPYAKAKMPVLNSIAEDYEDVAVIGINPNDADEYADDSFEKMKKLVEAGEIRYDAYLRDEDQEVAKEYGAVCTPDPFLFKQEKDGFRLVYHGRLDDALDPGEEPKEHHMREAIESVLAGEPIEMDFMPSRGCSIKWKEGNEPDYW
ncbi:MAG: thioredoxin family protein [Candidatus Nanohaloarchaeota archaeon QJJ-7]|nr:thioredoxin family protein [Candidatus Nanohaloarchaeota archaeon QJJ-7]